MISLSDREWVTSQVVSALPKEAFDHLVANLREEVGALGRDYADALRIDCPGQSLTVTGHWWYRGIYRVEPHGKGSRVIYRVENVATRARFLAYVDKFAYPRRMQKELSARLRGL